MEGWIKLHRKIANWQWASSPNHMTLFMQLLLRSNHKATKWRKETIEPGQILTGRKQLMDWTGLSEMQVRRCLNDLESTAEIIRKRSAKYSIITIANWKTYQADNREITAQQPANNQQVTTSKNDNNINNEISINSNKPSPLSFLFSSSPDIQEWLNAGIHETHLMLLNKFSHHELVDLVEKAFAWAVPRGIKAETWLYTFVSNKKTTAYGSNSTKASFKKKSHGVTPTPDNPTGDPYQAQLDQIRKNGETA